jgi:flagellar operon protein
MDSSRTPGTNSTDSVSPATSVRNTVKSPQTTQSGVTFKDILRNNQAPTTVQPLNFSAHALARLRSRNIQFTPDELNRLNSAVDKVASKGGREALFVVKHAQGDLTGLLVSVKNRVVITAVDEKSLEASVFTNIDSAAIV